MAQKKAIPFLQDMRLSFAFRAEDAFDLVSDDVMDELTAVGEVLARVEMFRMLCHVLTDAGINQTKHQLLLDRKSVV